ncbi:MAG: hypothetical protein NTZ38_02055, partial [Candidatus Taylorbacteria bacterium]|nr:hypothetical protein [Candidatus Taylorbacteria bacterium]
MKKIFTKKNILIFCLLLLICVSIGGNIAMAEVVGGGVPPVAKSATSPALPNDWGITGLAIRTLLIGLSSIAYVIFVVCSWFLGICGTMLNVGIQITTNLGAFINNTPVIYKIWEIVRDFSSMILIFFILYAAILKIIGMEKANYGNMIKNIIIMGILINFS